MTTSYKKPKIHTYRDLLCYTQGYELAMEIFRITARFPKDERYSLVDQMRRSSRSIPANIAEGWAKRQYENVFKRHLVDAIGSTEEVKVWLEMACECGYIDSIEKDKILDRYVEVSKMLESLVNTWQSYV